MKLKWYGLLFFALVSTGLLFAIGCAQGNGPADGIGESTTARVGIPQGAYVPDENHSNDFRPEIMRVEVGATITWTNNDIVWHSIEFGEHGTNDTSASSGQLNPGESWSHTFSKDGTYHYHCHPHPWMEGMVLVGDVEAVEHDDGHGQQEEAQEGHHK